MMSLQPLVAVDLARDPAAHAYVKNEIVDVIFAMQRGEITSREGPNRYAAGDALITGSTGDRWSVSRERFEAKYLSAGAQTRSTAGSPGGHRRRRSSRTSGSAEDLGGDHHRADLVEGHAAVVLGNVGGQQAEVAALLISARASPSPFVSSRSLSGSDLLVGRSRSAVLANQRVLFAHLLRRHHLRRIGSPRSATRRLERLFARCTSPYLHPFEMPAAPMPPPTHIVTMP